MAGFDAPQWAEVFVPDSSLAESFVRGTVIYFAVLILFRVVLKRQTGGLGMTDVLLIVLVSECVSPALSAESKSVPNAIVAVGTLLFWAYALDRLERHWPWLQRLLEPRPVKLIADGKFLHENMKKEGVTEEELLSQLRQNGVDDPKRVKAAYIESDGTVSVVPAEEGTGECAPTDPPPAPAVPADLTEAVKRFEESARELEATAAEHERRAAEHRDAAKAVRRTLARHRRRTAPKSKDP
jgi:uncharacterized membrane protein YcaP (DUF421 family)